MEAILFNFPSAADLALGTSHIRHPLSDISVSAAAAKVTDADDVDSPVSMSSGYCSDNDGDEQAAVRQGGDCWLPSTVVEQSPMSAPKIKRRHHLERRRMRHGRPRQHDLTINRSAIHEASLIDCLDPFRSLGDDDAFTATGEDHRLPPLQIDPRLTDCVDDDPLMDCRIVETETAISSMYSKRKKYEVQEFKSDAERGRLRSSESTSAVEDNKQFNLISWLKSPMGDGGNSGFTGTCRRASKCDEVERTEQLKEVIGSRLLVDLLLGQATYRNMTSSARCQHDAQSDRTCYQTTNDSNTKECRDNGVMNNGANLLTDNNYSVSKGTSEEDRMSVCPADGSVIAANTSSTWFDIAHSTMTAKKARYNDVIASRTSCELYEHVGRKLSKPSTSCSEVSRDFVPAAEMPSPPPTETVTSPNHLTPAKLPVVAISDCLYAINSRNDDEHKKQRVTILNAVVWPMNSSNAGPSANNRNQDGSQHTEIAEYDVTKQPSNHMYSSTSQIADSGGTRSRCVAASGGSLVLEALLRSAAKLDANKGSDVASVVMKDGLPTVLVEPVISFCSSTAPCSSDECHPSTSTSEPGLLHLLLTGQVDEADINNATNASRTNIDHSSGTISVSRSKSTSSGSCDKYQLRQVEDSSSSGSSSPAGPFCNVSVSVSVSGDPFCNVLSVDDSTCDVLDELDFHPMMTSSVDEITATIGIKEDFLEKYLQ